VSGAVAYRWSTVEDLPENPGGLANQDLASFASSWGEQLSSLRGTPELAGFLDELRREWAVETGVVEGLYSLPRGLAEQMVREGLDTPALAAAGPGVPAELVTGMVQDHLVALDRLAELARGGQGFTAADIKELHALITLHHAPANGTPLLKGAFKRESNDIERPDGSVLEFCPPEQVASEMERLLELHASHLAAGVPVEVEAAWLHHRFIKISPFQFANGLIARALASLVFQRGGWFPLVVRRDDVERYAAAQERAEAGELKPLVDLFAFLQRRTVLEAPGVVGDTLRAERVDQVIDAARKVLEGRKDGGSQDWAKAAEVAKVLLHAAEERLSVTAEKMTRDLRALASDYRFEVDAEKSGGSRDFFFKWHIVENAKRLDYFANMDIYRSWTRLMMRTTTQDEILVSFHAVGDQATGKLVAAMCFFKRDRVQRGEENLADLAPLSDQLFEIDPHEDPSSSQDRFLRWLEAGLVRGLELWRESLS
jgi:hypothetical protein